MRADGDVTLDELAHRFGPWWWVRQSRTSSCRGLVASLTRRRAKLVRSQGRTKREAAKHVESFGVGFWIRVRFPAPPPLRNFGLRISECGFECRLDTLLVRKRFS